GFLLYLDKIGEIDDRRNTRKIPSLQLFMSIHHCVLPYHHHSSYGRRDIMSLLCQPYFLWPELKEFYLISTTAPTSSSFCLIDAASSFDIACFTGFGASSTRAFASFSPKPVIARTSLMTWIFLSPELVRMMSNSVCSAGTSATAPAAAAGSIAMGAAAVTPNFSSSSFTKTESSRTVMFSIKPSTSSFVIATALLSYSQCLLTIS